MTTSFRFGRFTLDRDSYRLLRDGEPLSLAPKAIDLLFLFCTRPSALITKDDILGALWPGIAVTDNAITQVVSDLRQALGDSAGSPSFVQTVPRRGYRFVAPVSREQRDHDTERLRAQPRPVELYELVGRGRARAFGVLLRGSRRGVLVSSGDRARSDVRGGTRRAGGGALSPGLASGPSRTTRPSPRRSRRHCARWRWTASARMRRWRSVSCWSPASGTRQPRNEACGGHSRSSPHIPRRCWPTAA